MSFVEGLVACLVALPSSAVSLVLIALWVCTGMDDSAPPAGHNPWDPPWRQRGTGAWGMWAWYGWPFVAAVTPLPFVAAVLVVFGASMAQVGVCLGAHLLLTAMVVIHQWISNS